MKWWGKYKNSLTLEKRFILVIGSIVVIVLSAFGTSAYSFLRVRYEALLYKSMASSADQNTKNLQESLKSTVQLTDIIRTDTVIQSHLNLIYHESNYRTERSYEQIYWALENKYQAYKKDYEEITLGLLFITETYDTVIQSIQKLINSGVWN